MRQSLAFVIVTGCLALAGVAPVHAQTRSERLVVGEQRTFKPGYAVGDIAISNPAVCDFRVVAGRREVMLIASGEGFATLTIWDQSSVKRDEIYIDVVSREYAKLMADLAELLGPYPGVSIKRLGSRVVLSGTVQSADDLDAVRMIASAAGNTVSTVTIKAPPATAPVAAPAAAPVPAQAAAAPPAPPVELPKAVYDPTPPPPVRRPATTGPEPVSLKPAAMPELQPVSQPAPAAAPPPVAVPAAAAPPPPNVSTTGASRSTPTPAATGAVGSGQIEYLIEIYESPSSGPPPEVSGPQGTRLYAGRIRATPGSEVRQYVAVGPKTANPVRGVSIGLTPVVSGGSIQTLAVIDTNLPVGPYDQKKNPVWLRSSVEFTARPGQVRYITENELARSVAPTGATPAQSSGTGAGSRVADAAVGAGQNAVSSNVPGGSYVPSFGGIFGSSSGGGQPKARPTMLVIVVSPTVVGPEPR